MNGQVCKNYLEYEGIVFGEFMCPIEGYNLEDTVCCGDTNEQYCCSPRERAELRGESWTGGRNRGGSGGDVDAGTAGIILFFAIFIPVFIISCICCAVCIFFCYKKRIYEKVPGFAKD